MTHDERRNAAARRAIVAVNVAAADAAGSYANKNLVDGRSGNRYIGDFQISIAREEKCFHGIKGASAQGNFITKG